MTANWISKAPGLKLNAAWLGSQDRSLRQDFLTRLEAEDPGALCALPYLFAFWALPHQLPPEGWWKSWVILGGRGAGKTRAGAEWVRSVVEGPGPRDRGECARIALVSETLDQAREVMVFGDSGIIACSPPDRRPQWVATRKQLVWPNGAVAQIYSAHDPEALRGPQFDAAWLDELAKWKKAGDTWDMLQFALRLGHSPRQVITTTPRNVPLLRQILDHHSTVTTHAPTEANAANLAQSFLDEVKRRYGGTALGRQELDGLLLDEAEGAFWRQGDLDALRLDIAPGFDRIVVAVDPPVTGHKGSDACGIVVVGAVLPEDPGQWRAVVLEDASVQGVSPLTWARRAVEVARRYKADRLVAEVNQGGELVESTIRQVDALIPYRAVRATRGKTARAEPVAALYEQEKVHHLRGLGELESQMCRMTRQGYDGKGSPDRVDALVWALTDLMIEPAGRRLAPKVRSLG